MLALTELGYDEAEAEEKAVAAMGDPAETARELQKCYSFGWLVAGYVMEAVLALLLVVCIAGAFTVGSGIIDAVRTRLIPMSYLTAEQRGDARELDIRVDCGGSEMAELENRVEDYLAEFSANGTDNLSITLA